MLLALGLYIYDSALLLRSDEFVLMRGLGGRWTPRFGANGWKLFGKEPYVSNLLTPWTPLVRVHWSFEQGFDSPLTQGSTALPEVSRRPGVCATLVLLLVFVALPICLFVYPATVLTLTVAGLIYGACALTMVAVYFESDKLSLNQAEFRKLCVECLACPPFCINTVRKLCARSSSGLKLTDIADKLWAAGELTEIKEQMFLRVREQIDIEAEGTERMKRLEDVLLSLKTVSGHDRA